jgi:hypothetical protein
MACTKPAGATGVRIEAALDTRGQTRQQVIDIVDALLRQNGAIECGIMAYLAMELRPPEQSPSSDDLQKLGVLSLQTTAS